eukprot:m.140466 g.140466  ORF g.140466 m.140466 type:complete len:371 (+) comp9627_c0_seq3:1830-2942(+)
MPHHSSSLARGWRVGMTYVSRMSSAISWSNLATRRAFSTSEVGRPRSRMRRAAVTGPPAVVQSVCLSPEPRGDRGIIGSGDIARMGAGDGASESRSTGVADRSARRSLGVPDRSPRRSPGVGARSTRSARSARSVRSARSTRSARSARSLRSLRSVRSAPRSAPRSSPRSPWRGNKTREWISCGSGAAGATARTVNGDAAGLRCTLGLGQRRPLSRLESGLLIGVAPVLGVPTASMGADPCPGYNRSGKRSTGDAPCGRSLGSRHSSSSSLSGSKLSTTILSWLKTASRQNGHVAVLENQCSMHLRHSRCPHGSRRTLFGFALQILQISNALSMSTYSWYCSLVTLMCISGGTRMVQRMSGLMSWPLGYL